MNQLVASYVKTTIFMTIFAHTPMIFRYLVQQAPEVFCEYEFFLQRWYYLYSGLNTLAFILVRYICVFHSKNLTAIQEDFWICFLNIWTKAFSAIAYFVVSKITLQRPMDFYFCVGRVQKKSQADGHFVDYIWAFPYFLILIILLVIGVKSQCCEYNKKSSKKAVAQKGHYITAIRQMNLLTFPLLFVGSIEAAILVIIPMYQIEFGDLDSLTTYPGYLWVYMFHFYAGNIFLIQFLAFFYGRNIYLTNFAKRIIKEKINNFF